MGQAIDCWSSDRPFSERFRNLCITVLVMDSIFALLYAATALQPKPIPKEKVLCYQKSDYSWFYYVNLVYSCSAVVAVFGITIHGAIACGGAVTKDADTRRVYRYGNFLIAWFLLSFLLEAVASNKEPKECRDLNDVAQEGQENVGSELDTMVWQVVQAVLWLAWMLLSSGGGILARRHLASQQLQLPSNSADVSQAQGYVQGAMPQTVGAPIGEGGMPQIFGVPVQFPPPSQSVQAAQSAGMPSQFQPAIQSSLSSQAGAALPDTPGIGAASPTDLGEDLGVASPDGGSPPAAWAATQGAATGARWPAAGAGLVAQGRPVERSTPDREKAGSPSSVKAFAL